MPSISFSSPKVYREGIRFRSSKNCTSHEGDEKLNHFYTTQRVFRPIRFLKNTLRPRDDKAEGRNDLENVGAEHTLQSDDNVQAKQAEVESESRELCEEVKEEVRAVDDVKIDTSEDCEKAKKQPDNHPDQKTREKGSEDSEDAKDTPQQPAKAKQPEKDTYASTTPLQSRQFKKLGPGVHVLSPYDAAKFYEQNFGSTFQGGDMFHGINLSPCVHCPTGHYFAVGSPPMYYYGGSPFASSQPMQFSQDTNFNQGQFFAPNEQYKPGYDPEIRFDSEEFLSAQPPRSEPDVKFPHGYDPEIYLDSEHDATNFEETQTSSGEFSTSPSPDASHPVPHVYEMIPLGTAVSLRGLISAGNRNGDRGVITQYYPTTQRYLVELGETGETLSVKPENILQHIQVKIHSIKSQPDLNGCTGLVWYTENIDRYSLYIASLEKFASIKPENVMLEKGTVARVTGLDSRQELNGKWGTIKNWIEESNKYDIQISENQLIRVNAEHVIL